MKKLLITLFLVSGALLALAQNSGLKNGLGIHIGGDVTFNHGNSAMDNKTDVLYYYVPAKTYYGATVGLSYRLFISATRFFAEADLSAYYLGQKSVDGIHLGTILDEYDSFLVNDDMDEWGGSLAAVGGYAFPVGEQWSVDVFTGPEVRCAFSCRNDYDKIGLKQDLLIWHFNRWQMRWRLGAGLNYRHVGVKLYGSYDVTCKPRQVNTRNFTLSLGLNYRF